MTDNVIQFPRLKRNTPPQSIEELNKNIEETRREHIEYVIDETMSIAFQRAFDEGFDLGQDDCFKTTAMLIEAYRAALYKTVGIYHPLHDFAETAFAITDEDGNPVDMNGDPVDIVNESE